MKILVCVKQILDPEIPPRDFQVDPQCLEAVRGSASLVTNIFCENALEMALQLREQCGGEITAISFGSNSAEDSLRKALALKVDAACLVLNDLTPHPASSVVARVLAAGIRKLGEFDLILVGRESGDWGAGQTGGLLAEELHFPAVSFVDGISVEGDSITLQRQTDSGIETVTAKTPLLATITNNDQNVPRIPKTRDIMKSGRKPMTTWSLADLGLSANDLVGTTEIVDLYIPEKQTNCEYIDGDTINDKIDAFAKRIEDVIRTL